MKSDAVNIGKKVEKQHKDGQGEGDGLYFFNKEGHQDGKGDEERLEVPAGMGRSKTAQRKDNREKNQKDKQEVQAGVFSDSPPGGEKEAFDPGKKEEQK